MVKEQQLLIAIQALKDIINPTSRLKREMKKGEVLNGAKAYELAQNPTHLKQIAKFALLQMGHPVKL